jgi:hypothetical protein
LEERRVFDLGAYDYNREFYRTAVPDNRLPALLRTGVVNSRTCPAGGVVECLVSTDRTVHRGARVMAVPLANGNTGIVGIGR